MITAKQIADELDENAVVLRQSSREYYIPDVWDVSEYPKIDGYKPIPDPYESVNE